jgi:hypothetical protein
VRSHGGQNQDRKNHHGDNEETRPQIVPFLGHLKLQPTFKSQAL